jgi:hypothetical protein
VYADSNTEEAVAIGENQISNDNQNTVLLQEQDEQDMHIKAPGTPVLFVSNDVGTYSILDKNKTILGQLIPQADKTNLVIDNEGKILGVVDRLYSPWEVLLENIKYAV